MITFTSFVNLEVSYSSYLYGYGNWDGYSPYVGAGYGYLYGYGFGFVYGYV